ncbi:MAG: NrfD/PsrC family molybdoenzyme membrane anchor subunit [Deltaproteobacteria bacterium]
MADQHTNKELTYREVNEDVVNIMTQTGPMYYLTVALFGTAAVLLFIFPWAYQIYAGQGVTGLNTPVFWGVYLVNFVFWVGIAHAGTLISAMLFITHTPWRRAVARSAETMTLFALMFVGLFVFIHMGRPWNFYWTMPYPNPRQLWVNFMSPLVFDVVAISTYATSSIIFLFFGMIPDFASLSHSMTGWRKKFYGVLSLGWRGTDKEWHVQTKATIFFSSFVMPLVASVHSIVSWDFALSKVPGYSKTVFAPYFVTGALLSGFAGVVLMLIIIRRSFPALKKYITAYHFDRIGLFMLVLSLVWSYLTGLEVLTGLYADNTFENEHLIYKILTTPSMQLFMLMIFSNTILPLVLMSGRIRKCTSAMLVISIFVLIGMWLERYLIVPNSLSRKFLPWMWHDYSPTWVEGSIAIGAFCGFITLFMISIKIFPIISLYEVKEDVGIPMKKGHGYE